MGQKDLGHCATILSPMDIIKSSILVVGGARGITFFKLSIFSIHYAEIFGILPYLLYEIQNQEKINNPFTQAF